VGAEEKEGKSGNQAREPLWFRPDIAVAAIGAAATVIASVLGFYPIWRDSTDKNSPTLERRIEDMTRSLNASARTISEIEVEIEKRRGLVAELQKDAATASTLRDASRAQYEAVAAVLRAEIEHSKEPGWIDWLKNLLFTLIGAGISEGFAVWRRRRKPQED
jgi:hypothetical protein